MDSVPRETLDLILKQLLVYHHPVTERFAKITEDSKEDLLNARLVCRGFWASKSLQDAFGRVLGEIPLFREDLRLERFEAISQSKYADKMATLTFPGILVLGWSDEQLCFFKSKLCRLFYDFPRVENLRISHEGLEEPVDPHDFPRWAKGLIVHLVLEFQTPDIKIRSMVFPLEGLAAWSYSVLAYRDLSGLKFLTRLSVNLTTGTYTRILERGLFGCQNLEFLEIALGETTGADWHYDHWTQFVDEREGSEDILLPKLKTFRLTAGEDRVFHYVDVLRALRMFPNLQSLGLAYFLLYLPPGKSWKSLLQELQRFNLASIQLIFPSVSNSVTDQNFFKDPFDCPEQNTEHDLGGGLVVNDFANGLQVVPNHCRHLWLRKVLIWQEQEPYLGFSVFDK